ncbi:142ccc37-ba03-434d-8b02-9197cc3086f5 [Sclerotinia trifoliorum]|uniref:142ccc37-ba03-434d-8b02-9197cc3086f5 n=1 Tax=Sclerotinia trifoliorum TaxID=28548 RepID=A0A8H2ZNE7_9HELO|nr:142ccc37-ba03-434d-8b02-9197cc3086f5 [Sclerotinia trifoliorum]
MLPSNHGAHTVGKSLRRPIMKNISSWVGKSSLASIEAMGSAIGGMSGKRASPSVARSIASNSSKTWQPSHGIIFKDASAPGSPRLLSTTTVANHEQTLAFHSYVEDNYVLANAHVENSKTRRAKVAKEEILEPEITADVQELADEIEEDPARKELPKSELAYQMTEELFTQAKEAAPETPESYWSHTLYRGPEEDGIPKKVKIHYCRSLQTTEETLKRYFLGQKLVGFDIEWKAEARVYDDAKKNVSLIQLATEERVGLFHIALFPQSKASELVAPTMKKIMEDPEVTKVGVAISADCTRLRKYLGIHSVSIFELSHLYRLVKYTVSQEYGLINKRLVALAKQVEDHLHLPLFKGGSVRSSDWTRGLSIQQISYAASDSYAGYHLYNILESKRQALNPMPPRPFHADQNKPIYVPKPTPTSTRKSTRSGTKQDHPLLDPEPSPKDLKPALEVPLEAATEIEIDRDIEEKISTPNRLPWRTDRSQAFKPSLGVPKETSQAQPVLTRDDSEASSIALAADVLIVLHLAANPETKLTRPILKDYFIWYHNDHLSISQIFNLFTKPGARTAATGTQRIASHILKAISCDNLPFDRHRLREALKEIPEGVAWAKYRGLVEAVDTAKI